MTEPIRHYVRLGPTVVHLEPAARPGFTVCGQRIGGAGHVHPITAQPPRRGEKLCGNCGPNEGCRDDGALVMAISIIAAPMRAVIAQGSSIAVLDCGHATGKRFEPGGAKATAIACDWCRANADKSLREHGMRRGDGL